MSLPGHHAASTNYGERGRTIPGSTACQRRILLRALNLYAGRYNDILYWYTSQIVCEALIHVVEVAHPACRSTLTKDGSLSKAALCGYWTAKYLSRTWPWVFHYLGSSRALDGNETSKIRADSGRLSRVTPLQAVSLSYNQLPIYHKALVVGKQCILQAGSRSDADFASYSMVAVSTRVALFQCSETWLGRVDGARDTNISPSSTGNQSLNNATSIPINSPYTTTSISITKTTAMHFSNHILALISAAPILFTTAMVIDIDTQEPLICTPQKQTLSSNRKANLYNGGGCTGNGLRYSETGFGCGGGCHSVNDQLGSIYLEYGGSGPKPTAGCYTSNDCSGKVATSAGIERGNWNGCTNFPQNMGSCYFYYNC